MLCTVVAGSVVPAEILKYNSSNTRGDNIFICFYLCIFICFIYLNSFDFDIKQCYLFIYRIRVFYHHVEDYIVCFIL